MTGITRSEANAARVGQEKIRSDIGWFTVWMTKYKGARNRKYYLNEIKECMKRYMELEKINDAFYLQSETPPPKGGGDDAQTEKAMDVMRQYFPTAMGS
jgi:hypothetical protein